VIGGVEAVLKAHVNEFLKAGYTVRVIAGRGEEGALPGGAQFVSLPEIDSNHPEVVVAGQALEAGQVPKNFESLTARLVEKLRPLVADLDGLIVHNVLTKHFNLPLTQALRTLHEEGAIRALIAWCHDFTWTSPSSRSKVHNGHPWDLLRTSWPGTTYVTISKERQQTLADLFSVSPQAIAVVYNGVDPRLLLGISDEGWRLVQRVGLLESDLNLLMPVRVTQAKNIEFALETVAALKRKGVAPRLVLTGPPDPHDQGSMHYFQSLLDLRKSLEVEKEMRFVFESGPEPDKPLMIGEEVVGELYRISDVMFMPSHREGFGMPVLEAGMAGIPVVSREVPAASEIAAENALIFTDQTTPEEAAELLLKAVEQSPPVRFRQQVRKRFNWQAIFENDIRPILEAG
jgi:glycosyltransferase involved in cell wall biosynthesis